MRVARSSRARAGCVTGCLTRLMAALLVFGLLALIVFTVVLVRNNRIDSQIPGDLPEVLEDQRAAIGPASVVPPGEDSPGGLLVFTTRGDSPRPALSYLDGDPLAVRWDSAPLSGEQSPIPPALSGDLIYLADGARLHALSLLDGERRWSAELSAALPPGCATCLQPLDGAVAALTEDQTLQVLSAEDGEAHWQITLQTLPRELHVIDGSPAVVDTLPDTNGSALLVFDALSGAERQRIAPRCETDSAAETLSPGSPLLFDENTGALYALFGFEQHGCAQRWDATDGRLVWSASVPLETSGWPRTWTTASPLLGEGAIYLAGADGASILAIDTAGGALSTLLRSATYRLAPWALEGGTLLVHAERLDSSENDELWGIDAVSGEQLWQHPITRDNSSWTAHRAVNGFVVAQLLADPQRLQVALLDARRGVPLRLRNVPLGSAAWTGTTWTEDTAWLTIGALYAVDLRTGIPAQVWSPP